MILYIRDRRSRGFWIAVCSMSILAGVLLGVYVLSALDGKVAPASVESGTVLRSARPAARGDAVGKLSVGTQQSVASDVIAMKPIRTVEQLDAKDPVPDPMSVLDDFNTWVTKARGGDTAAMIGISLTLAGCRSFEPTTRKLPDGTLEASSQRCGAVPPSERVSPEVWMLMAAAAGDVRAMLDYGLNAKAALGRDAAALQNPAMQATREAALGYLEQAASAGLQEAFLALHEAHRSGWYGPINKERAASYLLALNALAPDSVNESNVQQYLRSLNSHELSLASDHAKSILAGMRA